MNQLQVDKAIVDGIEKMRQMMTDAQNKLFQPYDTAAGKQNATQVKMQLGQMYLQKIDPQTRAQLMYRMGEAKVREVERILGVTYPEPWEVAQKFREADAQSMPVFVPDVPLDTSQVEDRRPPQLPQLLIPRLTPGKR